MTDIRDLAKFQLDVMSEQVPNHSWDQEVWGEVTECGTQACLFGNVVIAAGYKPCYESYSMIQKGDGPQRGIFELASELLELDPPTADWVSAPFRKEADIRWFCEHIVEHGYAPTINSEYIQASAE